MKMFDDYSELLQLSEYGRLYTESIETDGVLCETIGDVLTNIKNYILRLWEKFIRFIASFANKYLLKILENATKYKNVKDRLKDYIQIIRPVALAGAIRKSCDIIHDIENGTSFGLHTKFTPVDPIANSDYEHMAVSQAARVHIDIFNAFIKEFGRLSPKIQLDGMNKEDLVISQTAVSMITFVGSYLAEIISEFKKRMEP